MHKDSHSSAHKTQTQDPHKLWLDDLDKYSYEERALIDRALIFATEHHAPQRRASGEPFITHPVAVAQILVDEFNADAQTVIAGLLHDTVEDTPATLSMVLAEFGDVIAHLVDGVTDVGRGDGREHIEDREERAAHTHKKVHEYAQKDTRVYLVKIADRWHNLAHIHALPLKNQKRLAEEAMSFHVVIARELGYAIIADRLEQLAQEICDRIRHIEHK